jgi:hypothetical protein
MTQSSEPFLGSIDPEILGAVDERAREIARGASTSRPLAAALALGSIPIALGALAKDVYGQAPSSVVDALQLALLLEYLEQEFYSRGSAATGLIPAADATIFTTILSHETVHVGALRTLITGRSAVATAKPVFDFTAKGAVPGFTFAAAQYEAFKALAQAFEDLGVRAYKGQVPQLMGDKPALNAALAIHSVEARHASEVRRLRGKKSWITGSSRDDLPAFLQSVYAGEENASQGTVGVTAIAAGFGGADAASEAFDEPLSKAQVTAIITPFLA